MNTYFSAVTIIGFAVSAVAALASYLIAYHRVSHRYFEKHHARNIAIETAIIVLAVCMGLSIGAGLLFKRFG